MRILHVLSTPRAEGTPNLVLDWLGTGMHEQDVFVLNSAPADLTDRLRKEANWYGEENYFSRGRRKFTDIAAGIRKVCLARKPDLMVCWPTGFSNWICWGAYRAGLRNYLVHAGNPPNRGFKGDWMSRYGIWPLKLLNAKVICCSDYVKNQFVAIPGLPSNIFHTVWNCARVEQVKERALHSRALRTDKSRRPTAIMVATLERHKDHATILNSIPTIMEAIPDFKLLLVGDGTLRSELEQLVDVLSIRGAVELLGTRNDVPELLGSADLFVLSTTAQEGLGTVIIEALAAGLPVIATDVPACRELLQNGIYGTLVPPKSPSILASGIISLLNGCRAQAPQAEDYAMAFTPQRMIERYLEIAEGI
jgi:glycosyltransferase involved in cell wall biosynthesis